MKRVAICDVNQCAAAVERWQLGKRYFIRPRLQELPQGHFHKFRHGATAPRGLASQARHYAVVDVQRRFHTYLSSSYGYMSIDRARDQRGVIASARCQSVAAARVTEYVIILHKLRFKQRGVSERTTRTSLHSDHHCLISSA